MRSQLSTREKHCLQWSAMGKTSLETATMLSISSRTVDFHIYNVCHKLGVTNRKAAIVMALQLGLIDTSVSLLG